MKRLSLLNSDKTMLRAWEIQFGTPNPWQAFSRLRGAEDAVKVLQAENRQLEAELRKAKK
jgi:hypothetical protein